MGASVQLFEFLVLAAAGQEWPLFAAAMAALCGVSRRAVRNMLDNYKFDAGWGLLYSASGMPGEQLPLFIEVLRTARKFLVENGEASSRALRQAVIQQALASPNLRGLKLPVELRTALLS